jgi:predicted acyltransferase
MIFHLRESASAMPMDTLQSPAMPDQATCDLPSQPRSSQGSSLLSQRLVSLDALRGFDMFWIVGGDKFVKALMKWGDWSFAPVVVEQLEHVTWEGFRFYDMIFPLFIFMAGVAMPFSLGKQRERGVPLSTLYGRVFRRMVFLFALGLMCNGILQWDPPIRVMGVLQRIAISTGCAGFIYLLVRVRGQVIVTTAILLGYWAFLALVPVPGGSAGDYTMNGNWSAYLDRLVLRDGLTFKGVSYSKLYYGQGDNEGLLSTIPAIATALLGVLCGEWLRSCPCNRRRVIWLYAAGLACIGVGIGWGQVFPIIKILWTSSYVLVAGGCSMLLLATFYMIIDVWSFRRWAFPFVVIGLNSITIYVVPRFIDFTKLSTYFFGGIVKHSGDLGPVLAVFFVLLCEWLFLYYLYRKQIFLRV